MTDTPKSTALIPVNPARAREVDALNEDSTKDDIVDALALLMVADEYVTGETAAYVAKLTGKTPATISVYACDASRLKRLHLRDGARVKAFRILDGLIERLTKELEADEKTFVGFKGEGNGITTPHYDNDWKKRHSVVQQLRGLVGDLKDITGITDPVKIQQMILTMPIEDFAKLPQVNEVLQTILAAVEPYPEAFEAAMEAIEGLR